MKLLFDTHVLLWAAASPQRISRRVRTLIENPENALVFSVASIWEIVIKRGLGLVLVTADRALAQYPVTIVMA